MSLFLLRIIHLIYFTDKLSFSFHIKEKFSLINNETKRERERKKQKIHKQKIMLKTNNLAQNQFNIFFHHHLVIRYKNMNKNVNNIVPDLLKFR